MTTWNWLLTFAVAKICPLLFESVLGAAGVFFMFSATTLGAFFYSVFLLKETKGNYDI